MTEFAIALRADRWIEPQETERDGSARTYPTLAAARAAIKSWASDWVLDPAEDAMDLVVIALPVPRTGLADDADIRIEAEELRAEILAEHEANCAEGTAEGASEQYYGGGCDAAVYAREARKGEL